MAGSPAAGADRGGGILHLSSNVARAPPRALNGIPLCGVACSRGGNLASEGKFIISYVHDKGGAFYQATVSEIDGDYRATWTVTKAGRENTKDGAVSKEQFKLLWNTIADAPVFHRSIPHDDKAQIDPVRFHVVSIAFESEGEQGVVTYLVPGSERDPQLLSWLRTLSATYNAA